MQNDTSATLYRMATPQHLCPFGIKSRWLLRQRGYRVDDRLLRSRAAQDAFKAEHGVETTPQTFIDGARIGGYDDVRRHFGLKVHDPKAVTYFPVIAVFVVSALLAGALGLRANDLAAGDTIGMGFAFECFVAIAMCVLAVLKLQNLESFTNSFVGYDLLARRIVPYAYMYPFAEAVAGILMAAGRWHPAAIVISLFIGSVGAISVIKAVYVDKRALSCACVGGGSNVPLGFLSLSENLMMVAMGAWMWLEMAR